MTYFIKIHKLKFYRFLNENITCLQSDRCPDLCCCCYHVSAIILFGFLQVSVDPVTLHEILN